MPIRRVITLSAALVAIALLAGCTQEPVEAGEVGDTLRLEFTRNADDTVDVTVDGVEAVTREDAEDWGLQAFTDPDGVAAQNQDFYFVRIRVEPVEGAFHDTWFNRGKWALVVDDEEYRGTYIFPPERAGCAYEPEWTEFCFAIAVPAGSEVDSVRLWGAEWPGYQRPRHWSSDRYAQWDLPS